MSRKKILLPSNKESMEGRERQDKINRWLVWEERRDRYGVTGRSAASLSAWTETSSLRQRRDTQEDELSCGNLEDQWLLRTEGEKAPPKWWQVLMRAWIKCCRSCCSFSCWSGTPSEPGRCRPQDAWGVFFLNRGFLYTDPISIAFATRTAHSFKSTSQLQKFRREVSARRGTLQCAPTLQSGHSPSSSLLSRLCFFINVKV